MTLLSWLQLALYGAALVGIGYPLGVWMARVYRGEPTWTDSLLGWLERWIYRVTLVDPREEMTWTHYATALLASQLVSFVGLFLLLSLQNLLPLNPENFAGASSDLSFNTAVSFVTNTNWQAYGGEATLSYLSQMAGLTIQNFLSCAAGMAVLVALIRGLTRKQTGTIGNYWVDLTRSTLYILLPLSILWAGLLMWQGVPQTLEPYREVPLMEAVQDDKGRDVTTQRIALGPVATQIAIKQLGTNGGGFYNVNSAHPLENPTPLSNFLQVFAILMLGGAFCFTYGEMVGDMRQGWAIFATMAILLVAFLGVCLWAEQAGTPQLAAAGVDLRASDEQAGGNMEGKETRCGIMNSALWATVTTAASNGSVNSMHDSYTPLGGLVPLVLMQLGEVVFGGVGSGLYGMVMFIVVGVFIAGLMVGRTPEYLGKKIEAFEMQMASLAILIPCASVLVFTAIAVVAPDGRANIFNQAPGMHGFSEVLYAYSSGSNNNGSAFAGLVANNLFYNTTLGIAMLLGRYGVMLPVLAIAGSLAAKKITPASAGTLPTHTSLFAILTIGVILLVGALNFIPALALGPIVEHLEMMKASQ